MKKTFITLAVALASFVSAAATNFNDIIPLPAQINQADGELVLKKGFTVSTAGMDSAMASEVTKFVDAINATTNLKAKITNKKDAFVTFTKTTGDEGYGLNITTKGIQIYAGTPAGLFYAFQTIKKLLPPNVSAGTPGDAAAVYTLPLGNVADSPRYEYRGFMLDVSRHFFTVDELKKMLDLMANYKLNRFHWHLTDDQGWRMPVDKWPLLTTVGATNSDILMSDFDQQKQWRAGKDTVYGPYAYTKEEIRDIVDYAKARHIEVIPEIDMPGHMVAAIHAYPELSTDPDSKLVSKASENARFNDFSHDIWNKGGVSWDVLDVTNPRVIEFVQDVIDSVVELFPFEYIHIGGDETDLIAWENSEACAQKLKELGREGDYRYLQTLFTKQVADYAKSKGRKVIGWNEVITSGDVDMDLIKEINPVIFCWIGGQEKAEANGLKHVYTPFNGGYYINRSYAGHDEIGAGRDGALSKTININPPAHKNLIGVQGTFWTEQVDRPEDMEYLALPRLIGIAEQGWSNVVNKDYEDFLRRLNLDKEYLDLGDYKYAKHQL